MQKIPDGAASFPALGLGVDTCYSYVKSVLNFTHIFRFIDPKAELEKGIHINEETISKLKRLMSKISEEQDDDEIMWISKSNNLIFKLADSPGLVFKMAKPNMAQFLNGKVLQANDISEARFSNMIKAKEVCMTNQLGQLMIPHAKKMEIEMDGKKKHILIAEEVLDIHPNESAQEEFYQRFSTELNETARQLATFIAKTGFNDVTWRNMPIINESPDFDGLRRVALIDLEDMNNVVNGFIGDPNGSCGLIGCLSEKHFGIVEEEIEKQGVAVPANDIQLAIERRIKELESNQQLSEFYERNGIVTGKELLNVDLDSLGLNLSEEGRTGVNPERTVTMREVAEVVIDQINTHIKKSSEGDSTKGKRFIMLERNKNPIDEYNWLGLPDDKFFGITEEEENQLWLRRIIRALVENGCLFKLVQINNDGYYIQA